jgi:hypothetical protein
LTISLGLFLHFDARADFKDARGRQAEKSVMLAALVVLAASCVTTMAFIHAQHRRYHE